MKNILRQNFIMTSHKNIAFFYPAENIGGAQILFSRVAEYLSTYNFDITVFDFGDSFISQYLNYNNIPFIHIVIEREVIKKTKVSGKYTFIVTPSFLFILNKYFSFHDSTRFLFWELHPNNIIEHTLFSYFYKHSYLNILSKPLKKLESNRISKVRNLVKTAHSKNGFYFMCFRNYITNSDFFNINIKPNYLPVPQNVEQENSIKKFNANNSLNIGWLSRLDLEKINILNLLIRDLDEYSKYNNSSKIVLHIIGEGSSYDKIQKTKNLVLVKAGRISGDDLSNYLSDNIDIAFSMGISALEFGSRFIPTLLVPNTTLHSYYKYLPNKYLWLHEVKGFDVATEKFHAKLTLDLDGIFSDINRMGLYHFGDLSYNYVFDNHSMNNVGDILIESLSLVELRYDDIKKSGIYSPNNIELLFLALKNLVKKILAR